MDIGFIPRHLEALNGGHVLLLVFQLGKITVTLLPGGQNRGLQQDNEAGYCS
jgi:hypothetical protein